MSDVAAIRVFIVDDHQVVREGLKVLLAVQPDMLVVGEASTARQALALSPACRPEVVLLDLRLPDAEGVDLIVALRKTLPATRILVVSSYERAGDIQACIEAGATGYLVKDAVDLELFTAVRAVACGRPYLSGTASVRLVDAMRWEKLTGREQQIIERMADGLTNEEMADRLRLTLATVKSHVHSILGKLGVRDRTAAVMLALQRGLLRWR